jgi:hypothetical protein
VNVHTIDGVAQALAQLQQRDPSVLASFIVSLAQDPGPIGEQVRAFIVGDKIAATLESLRGRIGDVRTMTERDLRYQRGKQIGERLGFILDSIQTSVCRSIRKARLIRWSPSSSAMVMPWRVIGIMISRSPARSSEPPNRLAKRGASLPTTDVLETLQQLLDADGYGVRAPLAAVLNNLCCEKI